MHNISSNSKLLKLSGFFLLECFLLIYLYKYYPFPASNIPDKFCPILTSSEFICTFFASASILHSIISLVFAIFCIFIIAPKYLTRLTNNIKNNNASQLWIIINLIGIIIVISPLYLLYKHQTEFVQNYGLFLWVLGGFCMVSGITLSLFNFSSIRKLLSSKKTIFLFITLIIPVLVISPTRYFWGIENIRLATFQSVSALLEIFGFHPETQTGSFIIGLNSFRVEVASSCAGISGMSLITLFLLLYIGIRWNSLRLTRAFLLIPIGIILSWVFNSIRISILLFIGSEISPELAINGFHSSAGWIMFTCLSLALILLSEKSPWFLKQKIAQKHLVPLYKDVNAAKILPFVSYMGISLLLGAFTSRPEPFYPVKILSAVAVLVVFYPLYKTATKKISVIPVLVGCVIAALWIFIRTDTPPTTLTDILASSSSWVIVSWVIVRILGTTLVIPVIEELFFRGYLLNRLNFGGNSGALFALFASSILFGVLHENWILAMGAGLLFGLLVIKSGKLFDAITAHSVANGLIALWALIANDWSII